MSTRSHVKSDAGHMQIRCKSDAGHMSNPMQIRHHILFQFLCHVTTATVEYF